MPAFPERQLESQLLRFRYSYLLMPPGGQQKTGPSTCAPAIHAEDQDGVPGTLLWPGQDLAVASN